METVKAVLESGDEILWSDHSNETSAAVISHSNIYKCKEDPRSY